MKVRPVFHSRFAVYILALSKTHFSYLKVRNKNHKIFVQLSFPLYFKLSLKANLKCTCQQIVYFERKLQGTTSTTSVIREHYLSDVCQLSKSCVVKSRTSNKSHVLV